MGPKDTRRVLDDMSLPVREAVEAAVQIFGVTEWQIATWGCRLRTVTRARDAAIWALRARYDYSYPELRAAFGAACDTTPRDACRAVDAWPDNSGHKQQALAVLEKIGGRWSK